MSTRYWRFLPEDTQEALAIEAIDEVHQCAKEIALENLDSETPEGLAWRLLFLTGAEDDDGEDWDRRVEEVAKLIEHAAEQGL